MPTPGIPYRDDWASLYREARAGRPIEHLAAKGFPRDVIAAVLQVLAARDGGVILQITEYAIPTDDTPQ